MPFADRYTEEARLTIKGATFLVHVRVHEVTDVRDGRIHEWGGVLWTASAPPNIPTSRTFFEDEQATLRFADGTEQQVLLGIGPGWQGGAYSSSFAHIQHRRQWE